MSVRRLSPTANLLKTSRLFSLPPPLPKPVSAVTATSHFASETATTPYPTNAAIETSDSSLGRGDWGLKRALPLKSTTKTSTPAIHVEHLDTIDHITDFASAASHTRTLHKWQDMDLSISASGHHSADPLQSVFDSSVDNIQMDIADGGKAQERWKFKGPWLAGQTNGEFSEYIARSMKNRKSGFRRFLSQRLAKANESIRRRETIESGEALESMRPVQITEEELDRYVRRLRKTQPGETNRKSELDKLVEEYLDLPAGMKIQTASRAYQSIDQRGPPVTHPSAGLSYLRTHAHTFNHPIYGPQEERPPVEARVLTPQIAGGRRQPRALLGVGGIVAGDDKFTFDKQGEKADVVGFEPDILGGGKLWIQPKHASIDPQGQIEFGTKRADKNALNVLKGESESENVLPAAALAAANYKNMPDLTIRSKNPRITSGQRREEGTASRTGRAQPFTGQDSLQSLLGAFEQGRA